LHVNVIATFKGKQTHHFYMFAQSAIHAPNEGK
jgi:hypothetical protein